MLLLDPILTAISRTLGTSSPLDVPEIRAVVMATEMTLGTSVWMVHRRHCLAAIAQMGAAMYVSFLLAFLPY